MAFLTRTDHTKKLRRFYLVRIAPNLFGEWSLVREWGRVGSPGTVRATSYTHEQEAQKAEQRSIKRRLRRGYTVRDENISDPAPQQPVTCDHPANSGLMLKSSGLLSSIGVLTERLARSFNSRTIQ